MSLTWWLWSRSRGWRVMSSNPFGTDDPSWEYCVRNPDRIIMNPLLPDLTVERLNLPHIMNPLLSDLTVERLNLPPIMNPFLSALTVERLNLPHIMNPLLPDLTVEHLNLPHIFFKNVH
ncbi:hypothetical protein TNCV_524111 [Trichonephila clavipes]|nr:hypothetical protein TNCV_524111 [Trichonephila clavipes]